MILNLTAVIELLKAAGGLVAVCGFPLVLLTYYRSVRTKRAEWLASLHEKFFETDRYAKVRRVLDYRLEPEYTQLVSAVDADKHHPLAEELFRYLNFFELLAGLRKLKQISDEEIKGLFDYDLKLISHHEFIVRALKPQGFEQLSELITKVPLLLTR